MLQTIFLNLMSLCRSIHIYFFIFPTVTWTLYLVKSIFSIYVGQSGYKEHSFCEKNKFSKRFMSMLYKVTYNEHIKH